MIRSAHSSRTRSGTRRCLAAALAVAALVGPSMSAAAGASTVPESTPTEVRADGPSSPASIADLALSDDDVRTQLRQLEQREAAAQAALDAATARATELAAEVAAAEAAEHGAATSADALEVQVKSMAVQAFTSTAESSVFGALASTNADEVSHGTTFLQSRADDRADLLRRYRSALDDRRRALAEQHRALEAAQAAVDEQHRVLVAIDSAKAVRTQMVAALDDRVESAMAEADSLRRLDPSAANELVSTQKALRSTAGAPATPKKIAGPAIPATPTTTKPSKKPPTTTTPPRSTPTVAVTTPPTTAPTAGTTITLPPVDLVTVNDIQVARAIAEPLRALMASASSAGFRLGGSGYRDPSRQIALRAQNCGLTPFDIYDRPASQCSPPTARPGRSMHEQGLAVDLTCGGSLLQSHSDPCWVWMSMHANAFGLYNLASEPWHWSINGS